MIFVTYLYLVQKKKILNWRLLSYDFITTERYSPFSNAFKTTNCFSIFFNLIKFKKYGFKPATNKRISIICSFQY